MIGAEQELEVFADPVIRERMRLCATDLKTFCLTFLPDRFRAAFSNKLHGPMFDILDDDKIQLGCISAPRGGGKTSLLIAWCVQQIVFGKTRYMVVCSKSGEKAIEFTEDIKKILMENEAIKAIFGDLKGDVWAKECWDTATGIRVLPRGRGMQVRGLLFRGNRPDRIVLDDMIDREEANNPEIRKELMRWLMTDVMPAVGLERNDWRILAAGTLVHWDSMIARLLKNKDWRSARLELCDDEFNPTWPEVANKTKCQLIYMRMKEEGAETQFYLDYRNLPAPENDSADYQAKYFQYYNETDKEFAERIPNKIESVVIVDPAKTKTSTSDLTAIIGIGWDLERGRIYVRDIVNRKLHPDEIMAETFLMAERLRARTIGIEVTGLGDFILQPFKNEMSHRGRYFEIVELHAKGHKTDRMKAPSPYYRKGQVFHNPKVCEALEQQELCYPVSERDDLHDALSHFVLMMEAGHKYFTPPDDYFENPEDIEKEYIGLDDEPALNLYEYEIA